MKEVYYIEKQIEVTNFRIIKSVWHYEDTKETNQSHRLHEDKLAPELVF